MDHPKLCHPHLITKLTLSKKKKGERNKNKKALVAKSSRITNIIISHSDNALVSLAIKITINSSSLKIETYCDNKIQNSNILVFKDKVNYNSYSSTNGTPHLSSDRYK